MRLTFLRITISINLHTTNRLTIKKNIKRVISFIESFIRFKTIIDVIK